MTPDTAPSEDRLRTALAAFDSLMVERDDSTSARRYADHAVGFLNQHRDTIRAALAASSANVSESETLTVADAALYERIDALLDEHAADDAKKYHAEHCAAASTLRPEDGLDAGEGLTAEDWATIERRFWSDESKWAAAGSGQTSAQQTGAAMVFAWLRSPQGGRLQRATRQWTSNELLGWDSKPHIALRAALTEPDAEETR